jgi:RNA-splicing ligase RtcB
LGGGNHFIEIDLDDDDNYWLVIHSGSRNFGLKVAKYYQNIAKKNCMADRTSKINESIVKKYKGQKDHHHLIEKEIKEAKSKIEKITTGLEYLEGKYSRWYLEDMKFAQMYAALNRRLMGYEIISNFYKLNYKDLELVESVHNYINFEDKIVRKGSISAHKDEKVIIPLNMADGIILGRGKGNEEWNYSAPHGSGRKMSRNKAKENIELGHFQKVMLEKKVWSSCINKATLDEAPQAYKKAGTIIKSLEDSIIIECHMHPVYNFKGQ